MAEHPRRDEFARAFEAAFARLQVVVEEAYLAEDDWPGQVAAAIRAAFDFAATDPAVADLLTNEALARGRDGLSRYRRLIDFCAGLLEPGRDQVPNGTLLPSTLEHSLAGGITMLVAQRVDQGRAGELPRLAADAIQFALTPYLGVHEARRIALNGSPGS
ncbi:MAG: hypothetical protein ACM3N0_09405 [Chloroflexota bacterium]